jgi:adenylosuccinate synthase
VYETLPGWSSPTSGARRIDALPATARRYIARLEELSGAPIAIISTGSDRDDTIFCDGALVSTMFGKAPATP